VAGRHRCGGLGSGDFHFDAAQLAEEKGADPLKHLGPGLYQPNSNQSGELLPLPTNVPFAPPLKVLFS